MIHLRSSQLDRIISCPASLGNPSIQIEIANDAPARMGTAVHMFLSEMIQLHADGIGDAEGAKILGITRDAYRRRRLRLGLPAKAVRMKRADPTGRF